jgi:hypothetical protein
MRSHMNKQLWHIYMRKGICFIPFVAKTKAGFYLDIDPVKVVKLDDLQLLTLAIEQAMAAGNPIIPTPSRSKFPKPVILKPAGVKNWGEFVKQGACFTIIRQENEFVILETSRNENNDWIDDPSLKQIHPARSTTLEIISLIVRRAKQRTDLI